MDESIFIATVQWLGHPAQVLRLEATATLANTNSESALVVGHG